MKTVRGGLLLAVGLLALLVLPATGWGAFPGANGRIAYINEWPGDIYTIRPDGSGTERLTNDVAPEGQLSWSASGYRLAYVRGHQLFTIGAHGETRPNSPTRRRVSAVPTSRPTAAGSSLRHGSHTRAGSSRSEATAATAAGW